MFLCECQSVMRFYTFIFAKAARNKKEMKGHNCVPIKVYLWTVKLVLHGTFTHKIFFCFIQLFAKF